MDTGFFPESNFILAMTGGLGFAFVSYWLHVLEAWFITIMWFSALSMTSIWFHIWRSEIAYRLDNTVALAGTLLSLYECYTRGPMAVGIGLQAVLYVALVFYGGYLGKCYAFDPDRRIATLFHASIHIITGGVMVFIAFFFPPTNNETLSDLLLRAEAYRSLASRLLGGWI
jgi:hypothetical protein